MNGVPEREHGFPPSAGPEEGDIEGFALLERTAVRRSVPEFEWRRFTTASSRHRLTMPLSDATVGLISTSGARVARQPSFDVASDEGDPSWRVIPADTPTHRLRFNHAGYDVRNAYADPDCVFPLSLLRRYADERRIGAVAARVGLDGADRPVDARELPDEVDALLRVLEEASVFGRVTPQQKRGIVHALQKGEHIVAMTGDGVNDALALKDADIGVAMGSGAPATRAVAQIVLLDGKFATMPGVVGEGRRVIAT